MQALSNYSKTYGKLGDINDLSCKEYIKHRF